MRLALDFLVGKEIVVLVWDASRGSGAGVAYRVAGLARFSITRHRVAESRISARYLGPADCLPPPGGPTATTRVPDPQSKPVLIALPARSPLPATLRFALAQPARGSAVRRADVVFQRACRRLGRSASCSVKATYTPAARFSGADRFTFTVGDGRTTSSPGTVTIRVTPVTDPPQAYHGAAETPEDTARELTLGATDPDGDQLSFSIVGGPSHGSLGALTGNRVGYTPAANFHDADSFTFRASDGTSSSNVATFRLTVTPVNDAPTCRDVTAPATPFETAVETAPIHRRRR